MMKRTWIMPTLVASIALATSAAAQFPMERGFGPGFGPFGGGMGFTHKLEFLAEELALSDGQLAEIEARLEETQESIEPLLRQMREIREAMREVTGPNYDAPSVAALAQSQGELATQLIVAKESTKADVLAVLTVEQREQLQALREERRRHRG